MANPTLLPILTTLLYSNTLHLLRPKIIQHICLHLYTTIKMTNINFCRFLVIMPKKQLQPCHTQLTVTFENCCSKVAGLV